MSEGLQSGGTNLSVMEEVDGLRRVHGKSVKHCIVAFNLADGWPI